jgi:hypothetical protein
LMDPEAGCGRHCACSGRFWAVSELLGS